VLLDDATSKAQVQQALDAGDEELREDILEKLDDSIQRRAQTVLAPLIWQVQTGIAAISLLGSIQMHQGRMSHAQFLASVQLPFTALFIYMAARRFGAPSVFELRDSLAEKLILTDADKIKPSDVQLPLPGFYIQMPPGEDTEWDA